MRLKRSMIIVGCLVLLSFLTISLVEAESVRGYSRQDGTYVQPYQRTHPDRSPYNNYGFPGNYNPNTGRITPGNPNNYLDKYNNPNPSHKNPYYR